MANLTGFLKDNQGIYIIKDPQASIIYALDWIDYLKANDSLSTTTVTIGTISGDTTPLIFPNGSGADVSIVGTKTQFRISGGTNGNVYTIRVRVTTAQGDTDTRQFRIIVKNKELE